MLQSRLLGTLVHCRVKMARDNRNKASARDVTGQDNLRKMISDVRMAFLCGVAITASLTALLRFSSPAARAIRDYVDTSGSGLKLTFLTWLYMALPTSVLGVTVYWKLLISLHLTRYYKNEPETQEAIARAMRVKKKTIQPADLNECLQILAIMQLITLASFEYIWHDGMPDISAETIVYLGFVLVYGVLWNGSRCAAEWDVAMDSLPWEMITFAAGSALLSYVAIDHTLLFSSVFESIVEMAHTELGSSMVQPFMVIMASVFNEFVDGHRLANAFIPVCVKFASNTGTHPLFYSVPVSATCSIPAIMPVASLELTIAHAYSGVGYYEMFVRGVLLKVVTLVSSVCSVHLVRLALLDGHLLAPSPQNKTDNSTVTDTGIV